MMNEKTIDILVKSGIGTVLAALLGWVLYLAYLERRESRDANMNRLMPVLESLADSMDKIADTYSPER